MVDINTLSMSLWQQNIQRIDDEAHLLKNRRGASTLDPTPL